MNKFVNLKKEYRDFLGSFAQEIKNINIDEEITKKKCSEINKLHQKTYNTINIESSGINVNDINHIILNYNKENTDVELIKKFIKLKNLNDIKQIIESQLWDPFITKLSDNLFNKEFKLNNKKFKHLVEKGVYKLLKSTIEQFRGCWEIAEFKDGKLKKLEIIEPEQIDYITNYIRQQIKINVISI